MAEAPRKFDVSWQWVLTRCETDGLRRVGQLHHLGVGHDHAGNPAFILVDHTSATVTYLDTVEILSTHHIDPTRSYWRNNDKANGRWPGASSNET